MAQLGSPGEGAGLVQGPEAGLAPRDGKGTQAPGGEWG